MKTLLSTVAALSLLSLTLSADEGTLQLESLPKLDVSLKSHKPDKQESYLEKTQPDVRAGEAAKPFDRKQLIPLTAYDDQIPQRKKATGSKPMGIAPVQQKVLFTTEKQSVQPTTQLDESASLVPQQPAQTLAEQALSGQVIEYSYLYKGERYTTYLPVEWAAKYTHAYKQSSKSSANYTVVGH